ncbi:VanZ family protein [Neptunomonas japonica]|uniref:VanZ family protein n=1 Tax=Neptunomonas japonica TaxID=417574 RepID=UPI000428495C|nr:VanZ family protein [Neptunomonas japonica]
MRFFFYFVCFLIAYGSLFPFEFSINIDDAVFLAFINSWNDQTSLGDVLGNIILFIPYGFLGLVAFAKSKVSVTLIASLSALGILLALACQVAQLYLPSRSPALVDVYWNILGLVIGVAFAYSYKVRIFIKSVELYSFSFPFVLLGLWGASRLVPFVPSIDLQSYKNALKPLLVDPEFDFYQFVFLLAAWLAAAHLFFYLCKSRVKFLQLIVAVVTVSLLEIIIVKNDLSVTDVASWICALFLWPLLPKSLSQRSLCLVFALLIGVVSGSLFPFEWQVNNAGFEWVPFSGFLSGSMLTSAGVFAQKLFVIGSIFFLLCESGWLSLKVIVAIFSIFLGVEVLQSWLVGHLAEVTDPLLVLFGGLLFRRIFHSSLQVPTTPKAQSIITPVLKPIETPCLSSSSDFKQRCFVALAGSVVVASIMLIFYFLVRLPGVPYNIRELFRFEASGFDLFFVSLALLWFGVGAAWMGKVIAKSSRPIMVAPVAATVVAIILYFLFFFGVTTESISDVAGSSVWVHRVGTRGIFGPLGISFVEHFGSDNLRLFTEPVEPIVRFGALFGPVFILFGVFFATLFKTRWLPLPWRKKGVLRYFLIYCLYMLPWFLVCKVIAFDLSSTDNLNELIARDASWGLGGGGYLYLLVFIVVFSAVLLSTSLIRVRFLTISVACLSVLVLIPVGWFLLNKGLVENVGKYGLNYSGVDFLLGPDRKNLVSSDSLFLRWIVVQLSGVIVLATGAHLYLRWVGVSILSRHETVLSKSAVNTFQDIEVNLSTSQLDFLNELASVKKQTISFIVRSIIDNAMSEEQGSSDEFFESLEKSISEYSRMKTSVIRVEPNQIKWVAVMASKGNVSDSRVIRKTVEQFMTSCSSGSY